MSWKTKDLFIQGSDLFTLTSHTENFGLAVLEALAVGVPVLVTPGVALAAIVQEHQLGYVPELNVLAIAEAIEEYLTHLQAAKDMSDCARQVITPGSLIFFGVPEIAEKQKIYVE